MWRKFDQDKSWLRQNGKKSFHMTGGKDRKWFQITKQQISQVTRNLSQEDIIHCNGDSKPMHTNSRLSIMKRYECVIMLKFIITCQTSITSPRNFRTDTRLAPNNLSSFQLKAPQMAILCYLKMYPRTPMIFMGIKIISLEQNGEEELSVMNVAISAFVTSLQWNNDGIFREN